MSQELWQKAAQNIVNAGQLPLPISDTLLEIMQVLMTKEQAEFVQRFKKPMNMEELKESTQMDEADLQQL